MRVRFWNAWALAAGFVTASVFAAPLFGQESKPAPKAKTVEPAAEATAEPAADKDKPKGRTIELVLSVSGLGAKGCEIEIKPGNPACAFKPKTVHVKAGSSNQHVQLKDVEIRGADRNCSVALTIREEGQPAKTIYRGYRVAANPKPGSVESFICWMSTPSKSAAIAASITETKNPRR